MFHPFPNEGHFRVLLSNARRFYLSGGKCRKTNFVKRCFFLQNDVERPLYPGSNVTKGQSLLLLLSFVLRHGLTGLALDDLLSLLNVFLPDTVPATKHKFYKSIAIEEYEVIKLPQKCLILSGNISKNI